MLSSLAWWYSDTNVDAGAKSESHFMNVSQNNATVFTINEKQYTVDGQYPLSMSLNTFIREVANLKGTKFMCEEGGCGCCIVSVSGKEPATGNAKTFAVNSCLTLVLSCHGWSIITVEGLGSKHKGYHPLQVALARFNGTQCGFCSPGMVMNMYNLLAARRNRTMQEVEDSFGGNICRCTGYRPILDAFKSFAVDAPAVLRDKCADIEDMGVSRCRHRCWSTRQEPASQEQEDVSETVSTLAVPVHLVGTTGVWYRVDSLASILQVFSNIGEKTYQLVAGNTARGAYPVMEEPQVYIDIRPVPELQTVLVNTGDVTFGANISLENFMTSLRNLASNTGYEYFTQIADHVDLVANLPVRNVGTVAGNLLLKHQHNEFQSDIFLCLEVVGANLIIMDKSGNTSTVLPERFLELDMNQRVITQFILYPRDSYTLKLYKIMPRAQNAHAVVNAGFLFKLSIDGKVMEKPRIVYGGITSKFVHASNTETYLTNKNLYQQQTLTGALQQLNPELQPTDNPPEMGAVYRKGLAEGLFYKCVLNLAGQKAKKTFMSGGTVLSRPVSSGRQTYQTTPSDYPVGQPIPKLEAFSQCSGEAQFVNDRNAVPGELYAALVLTTVPTGNIFSIDATEALVRTRTALQAFTQEDLARSISGVAPETKYPGVVAFYKAQDIPGRNNITPYPTLFTVEEEELFCSGTVLYNGQPVGVIVAETRQVANKARKLVKIKYKGTTKPTIFLRDVIPEVGQLAESKKSRTEPTANNNTSVADAVTHVIEGKFDLGLQYHYHMETQTCSVVPTEDGFEVYASTQWMDLCQRSIAMVLGIQEHRVQVIVRRMGGAFGAKISRQNFVACSCSLAAHYLRRPVRMVLTMEDNMRALGKRPEVATDYKVGVDDSGKIHYLESYLYENNGSSNNDPVASLTEGGFTNCYDSTNWSFTTREVITNTPCSVYMRGPGTLEGMASIEYIMEHIAKVCNVDPIQVRRNNIKPEDPILKFMDDLRTSSQYASRKQQIDQFNKDNRWLKKGIALIPMNFPVPFAGNMHCMVSIYAGDGSVAVSHGGTECGQGINTKVAQAVSYTLKIPLSLVTVKPSDTLTAANDVCTGASITSDMACFAAIECCKELLRRLEPTSRSLPNPTWEALLSAAVNNGVNLVASKMFASNLDAPVYSVYGACVLEVMTDMLTGIFQITRADIREDAGNSINPNVDIGQIEGAFVMGLGYFSSEKIVIDPNTGECLTDRSWNYYPPGAKDIPIDFRVEIQKNAPNPVGILRSKTTGEPPLCLAVSLVFALRYALESARKDAGDDGSWFRFATPFTIEQIWLSSLTSLNQFKLQ